MDSQLDESNLTLRDISLIIDEFVRVLSGMYHTRIEYPKEHEVVTIEQKMIRQEDFCFGDY